MAYTKLTSAQYENAQDEIINLFLQSTRISLFCISMLYLTTALYFQTKKI